MVMDLAGFITGATCLFLTLQCITAQQSFVSVNATAVNASVFKVQQGTNLEMNCSVTDTPVNIIIISYQWFHETANITLLSPQMQTLVIMGVSYLQHLGKYYCIATTSTGQQIRSPAITLSARFPEVFPATGHAVEVVEGHPATLRSIIVIPVDGINPRIQWYKLQDNSNVRHPVSSTTLSFHIESAEESDDGRYQCVLSLDNYAPQDADITLSVITKPRIFLSATSTVILLEQSASILCSVISKSMSTITWYFNGNVLVTGERTRVTTDATATMSTLDIQQISYAEAGSYTCWVTNRAGNTSQSTNITVQGRPQIIYDRNSSSVMVPVSSEVGTLNCPFYSNPQASNVEWKKDDWVITNDTIKYQIFTNGTLQILNLALNDSGNFTCKIQNGMGSSDPATYILQVIDIPAQPHNLHREIVLSSNWTHSVLVSWDAPVLEQTQPVDNFIMKVYHNSRVVEEIEVTRNSTTKILELLPGQNYNVSLQAVNSAGFSPPAYLTLSLPVVAPLLSFNVSAPSDGRSVLTTWQLHHDGGAPINTFNIKVYTLKQRSELILSQNVSVSSESHRMMNLEPATQYNIKVYISNGVMETNMNFIINTTIAPPSQPSTPEVTLTTTHLLEMKFTVEQGSYPITAILLNVTRLLSDGDSSTSQSQVSLDDSQYVEAVVELGGGQWEVRMVLTDLRQLQLYTFQVAAISAVGEGVFSDPSDPTALDDGRVLYYIVFSVVGGAAMLLAVIIIISVLMLRTTRRIQKNKRTLSINGSGSQKQLPQSFVNSDSLPHPLSPTSMDARSSSRPSLQLNINDGSSMYRGDTPLSSSSDYKHHMLSSSVTEAISPIYDRLDSVLSEESRGVRNGLSSSDGARQIRTESPATVLCASDGARYMQTERQRDALSACRTEHTGNVSIALCSSEGRIDSVVKDSMPPDSGQRCRAYSNPCVGKVHSNSSNSLHQTQLPEQGNQQQQLLVPVGQSRQQHSLNHLHVPSHTQNLHWPRKSMTGSTPMMNCRNSCESMLGDYRPTDYMTDV